MIIRWQDAADQMEGSTAAVAQAPSGMNHQEQRYGWLQKRKDSFVSKRQLEKRLSFLRNDARADALRIRAHDTHDAHGAGSGGTRGPHPRRRKNALES